MFKKEEPKQEPTITVTPAELSALIDARLAEREAKPQAPEPQAPVVERPQPDPLQRAPADPEFQARLLTYLDAENGDIGKTLVRIYSNIHSTSPDQPLVSGWESWRRHPVTSNPIYSQAFFGAEERQALGGYIARLDHLRKHPHAEEAAAAMRAFPRPLTLEEEIGIRERELAALRAQAS